jgi:hypothetical protein
MTSQHHGCCGCGNCVAVAVEGGWEAASTTTLLPSLLGCLLICFRRAAYAQVCGGGSASSAAQALAKAVATATAKAFASASAKVDVQGRSRLNSC